MPKFVDQKQPSPEKARREPRAEPAGLDAFAAQTAITPPPSPEGPTARSRGRVLPASPMPVRFPPDVKTALERLSQRDRRSQQQILELVAFPAILEAAAKLG